MHHHSLSFTIRTLAPFVVRSLLVPYTRRHSFRYVHSVLSQWYRNPVDGHTGHIGRCVVIVIVVVSTRASAIAFVALHSPYLVTHVVGYPVIVMQGATSSQAAAAPTLAELQQHIAQLTADNSDLNRRGVAVQQALEASQVALIASQGKLLARTPPQPKIPSPRIFDGKMGQGVVTWIEEVEKQFPHYGAYFADEAKKIEHALNFVNHDVGNWFNLAAIVAAADGKDIDTWVKFVAALFSRFRPVEAAISGRANLDAATQSGTVQAYAAHFLSVMTYIPDMNPADQIYRFSTGLKPAIRLEVMKMKPKTLSEAIELAVGIDVYTRTFSQPASSSSSSSSYRPHQQQSSFAPSSSSTSPMDLNNLESQSDPESSLYLDSPSSHESLLLAVVQQQQSDQAQMQQQLNALIARDQDRRPNQWAQSSNCQDNNGYRRRH
jgi:Ty3 transposon capsid-like protein